MPSDTLEVAEAEDVPFNIQQLANVCWELLRESGGGTLTSQAASTMRWCAW
jgi:hypothetical protein